jgi:hypothetical protein
MTRQNFYLSELSGSLAIQIISMLIEGDEVSLISFWDYLSNIWITFKENRPKVIIELLKLLEQTMDFAPKNESGAYFIKFSKFFDEISRWVWQFIRSEHENIQKAAFITLGTFKANYFHEENVPNDIQSTVSKSFIFNEQSEENKLNNSMFLSLIHFNTSEYLFKKIIQKEIQGLPRNTAHNALKRLRSKI